MWDRLLSQDDVDSLYFNGGLSSPVEIPNSDIQINLSPNPINDLMIIDHPENYTLGAYQIFNSIGKIVRSGTDLTENQIDLSTIPSGTYFISLHLKKPSGERIIANQKFSKN
ncbi:MAG: T9SS type A sorting domain-containing protein [Saprospiraceae bacterium]